ncbi:MAG: hypothetical protein Q9160_003967 [Pyrenula sp. 1 TL-2023]
MSTFTLPNTNPSVSVSLTEDLARDQLIEFPAFKTWLAALQDSLSLQQQRDHVFHASPFRLQKIKVQSCDFFGGGRLGFVKLKAEISNRNGETLPGSIFLRGGSVAMLLLLSPRDKTDEKYVVLTVQPRVPAGSLAFVEIPAGMLDDSGTFAGAAAKELKEETGLEIPQDELIDMTALAVQADPTNISKEKLQAAVYPSCGGSDEFIPIFLWQKEMERKEIEEMRGRLTGLRDHGEKITLQLCPLQDIWKVCSRDGKALAAYALYTGLRNEGKV